MMTDLAALRDRRRALIERRQSASLERIIEVEVELRAIDQILSRQECDGAVVLAQLSQRVNERQTPSEEAR